MISPESPPTSEQEAIAADSPPRPTVHIPNPIYLYVIFDGPPSHESGRFVEVEDENGQGVSAGKWEMRGGELWSLGPFLQPPAEAAEQPATDLGTMVARIQTECRLPLFVCQTERDTRLRAEHRLGLIDDITRNLKTALEQREGVMGEMGGALLARAVAAHDYLEKEGEVMHKPPFLKCDHPACVDARALVNQYEEAKRQPREASSTEGEQ